MTLQSSLYLKTGDQVWIELQIESDIHSHSPYYRHLYDDQNLHPFHGFHVGGGNSFLLMKRHEFDIGDIPATWEFNFFSFAGSGETFILSS